MTTRSLDGGGTAQASLLDPLHERLPGLAHALDVDFVADRIRQLFPDRSATIENVSVGKLWMRDDGTCGLRYGVRLSGPSTGVGEPSVVGRVHPDAAGAAASLAQTRHRLAAIRTGRPLTSSLWWSTAVVPEAGLALCRLPVDPDLPTLVQAMDPRFAGRLSAVEHPDAEPTVEVVHLPREGACVLRYLFPAGQARCSAHPRAALYGKVYRDGFGQVVDGFLRALTRDPADHGPRPPARVPKPVAYVPTVRLLVTEELPGEPLVPRLMRTACAPEGQPADDGLALRRAVRGSGAALAGLHGSDLTTAPVRSAGRVLAAVRREIDLVASYWPDVAARVRSRVDLLSEPVPGTPGAVLSHGDYTPSQVLVDGDTVSVVDLDTLCRADPALDLGTYLAYLHLLAAKAGGQPTSALTDDLTAEFLHGYRDAGGPAACAATAPDRIGFFMATTLARTALSSCRQLKRPRLELAMSLLDDVLLGGVHL